MIRAAEKKRGDGKNINICRFIILGAEKLTNSSSVLTIVISSEKHSFRFVFFCSSIFLSTPVLLSFPRLPKARVLDSRMSVDIYLFFGLCTIFAFIWITIGLCIQVVNFHASHFGNKTLKFSIELLRKFDHHRCHKKTNGQHSLYVLIGWRFPSDYFVDMISMRLIEFKIMICLSVLKPLPSCPLLSVLNVTKATHGMKTYEDDNKLKTATKQENNCNKTVFSYVILL